MFQKEVVENMKKLSY